MTATTSTPPRVYYVDPALVGAAEAWPALFDRAAALGFDAVMTAPLFAPGADGNRFLLSDDGRLDPRLADAPLEEGVARLAAAARARDLALLVDVVADRVAAASPLAARFPFRPLGRGALDPRLGPRERDGAGLVVDDPAAGDWLDHLAGRLAALAGAGVAGFRFLAIDRLPPAAWTRLLTGLAEAAPPVVRLAWTPGTNFAVRHALEGVGFDAAFSSLAWWDQRADWLVAEHRIQRRLGPAIAFPEAPYGPRLSGGLDGPRDRRRAAGRALWTAAALGDGLLVPMGFEYGAARPMAIGDGSPEAFAALRAAADYDLADEIAAANLFLAARDGAPGHLSLLTGPAAPVTAVLRADAADLRRARAARLVLVNPDLRRPAAAVTDGLLSEIAGGFTRFTDIAGAVTIGPGAVLPLGAGGVQVLEGRPAAPVLGLPVPPSIEAAVAEPRFAIEAITPAVDGGRFPVKRTVGEAVAVACDIVGDGHDKLAAALLWRAADEDGWHEVRLAPLVNDRWSAVLPLERLGRHVYTVEVWKDLYGTWAYEVGKKRDAGLDLTLELEEGRRLVERYAADGPDGAGRALRPLLDRLAGADAAGRLALLTDPATAALMAAADPRAFRHRHDPPIPVDAERTGARFAAWYELFPRSMSGDETRHGTFDDVIAQLPRVRDMGFDVLYFPPIHPIGRTNRKGRNNTLTPAPDDPGSPYAIGSEAGGHDAIHPELGTLDDFRRLVAAAADHGLEIALDFAIQCSPDHPWLKQHPEWFEWRPDGSIRYAENPPKRYEDIVNVDFYAEGAIPSLWTTLRDVTLFWVEQGIRLFRVDNPHTKSFPFWEWLIADVRGRHPDTVFLAEAFTRPKVMYRLAKIGFSQSYTYFTWRNAKWELEAYLTELNEEAPRDFFRPHFFVNTPDINPVFLQAGSRAAHLIRAALAATLSGLWGVYNGFELLEALPVPGKEEYLDSEKYQLRAWDFDRPGNIVAEITALNRIRRDNPALHSHLGVRFLTAWNDKVMVYEKASPARDSVVFVAVSLDPDGPQEADVEIPLWRFGLPDHGTLELEDLIRGGRVAWTGKIRRLRLDPADLPFAIWRVVTPKET